jgi:hypothetical protein
METQTNEVVESGVQALQPAEMQEVVGGVGVFIDVSGMPDRSVTCGTMWLRDRLLDRFSPYPR